MITTVKYSGIGEPGNLRTYVVVDPQYGDTADTGTDLTAVGMWMWRRAMLRRSGGHSAAAQHQPATATAADSGAGAARM